MFQDDNLSLKIFVSYHKPSTLIKNDILTPIYVGKALKYKEFKDVKVNFSVHILFLENIIDYNTDYNILSKNRDIAYISERLLKIFTNHYVSLKKYNRIIYNNITSILKKVDTLDLNKIILSNQKLSKIKNQKSYNNAKNINIVYSNYDNYVQYCSVSMKFDFFGFKLNRKYVFIAIYYIIVLVVNISMLIEKYDFYNGSINGKYKFIDLNLNINSIIYLVNNLKGYTILLLKNSYREEEDRDKYKPYIIYYTDILKTWDIYFNHTLKSEYFKYLKFTASKIL